jgi:hypothetical protein
MTTATITKDPKSRYTALVRFRYDRAAVDAIKTVPGRSWDPDRKVWTVPIDVASVARRALELIGMTVQLDMPSATPPTPPPRPAPKPTPAAAVDLVLAALPPDQRRRVLRALAAATHPDAGGDLELSKYVNARMDRT